MHAEDKARLFTAGLAVAAALVGAGVLIAIGWAIR